MTYNRKEAFWQMTRSFRRCSFRLEWLGRWFHGGARCNRLVCRRKRKLAKDHVEGSILDVNHDGIAASSATLNKDSAFTLVTLNSLKEWWNKLTGQSVVEETAETTATTANTAANTANAASQSARSAAAAGSTVATGANTVATGANAVAAGTGTVANWSLAASFRAVASAIKSIPVFGWIVAGISALVAAVTLFTDSEDESTEAIKKNKNPQKDLQEEMSATERVHAETIKQVAEERGKVILLNDILHDNSVAIGDRRKALNELKRIIPSYNALLDAEGKLTRERHRSD